VLIRHDLDVDGAPITFYSLLAHLDLPEPGSSEANAIPWLQALGQGSAVARRALAAGDVVLLDQRVEAGDLVGKVGIVSRGPEQGSEVHFEIFTTDRMPGDFGRTFRYVNAGSDGALSRRADLVAAADANGDQQVDAAELQRFFRSGSLDRRQGLRRVAIRHRHEWGSKNSEAEFLALRELAGLSEADRRRLYRTMVTPYVFWTDELSQATGLPANQTVYFYNPLTFLIEIASRDSHVELPKIRGRDVGETGLEPRKLAKVPLADWTAPRASPIEPPLFGPPIGLRLATRRREDIPLIELAPTDSR
jgi:hypothetical protein